MNKSRLFGKIISTLVFPFVTMSANAALVDLGGGLIYDDDLNITWLANANAGAGSAFDDGLSATDGQMTWASASAWAASLTVGGVSGWRLPTTMVPDPTCDLDTAGSLGTNCTGSEMGHMFYTELGGIAESSIITSGDPALLALFSNIQSSGYWSSTELAAVPANRAWGFAFSNGNQFVNLKNLERHAWAVHDGMVPVPPAIWLFGSGLLGLIGVARKKAA